MYYKALKSVQIALGLFYGNKIKSGPFRGLKINRNYFGSSYLPKIYGSYEIEIAELLHQEFERNEIFLDIGCAGGYYMQLAVQVNPGIKLHGFDINQKALDSVSKLLPEATLENISFDMGSAERIFEIYKNKKKLILLDIEGYEWEILMDFINLVQADGQTTLVVELHNHDSRSFDVTEMVSSRVLILNYRFKTGVPLDKMVTENEFREQSTQYLIWQNRE